MAQVSLQVVGCGEAFGAGGRMQSCYLLRGNGTTLVDCGTTSLVAMRRLGVDPLALERIAITHFHADHMGGLPFLELDRRANGVTEPVEILGPHGIEAAYARLFSAMFPGSASPDLFRFTTYADRQPQLWGEWTVTAVPVVHQPETHPHALRLEGHDKVVAFSGDTAWTDALIEISRGADLFVCECVGYDQAPRYHMHWLELSQHPLECRRLLLTHMDRDMLQRLPVRGAEGASEGLVVLL